MYAEDFCTQVFSLQEGVVKGTEEFTLYYIINAVSPPPPFGPNQVNVSHESIRDITMFSMLIFEKNLLNKNYTGGGM